MKNTVLGMALALIPLPTLAATDELSQKKEVLDIMKRYAEVRSCMHSFTKSPDNSEPTTLKDIFTVERDSEFTAYSYYVLWSGDLGCAGGSGTLSSYVTEVAKYGSGSWKPFTVQTDYAFGEDIGINYRFIDSLKRISKDKFILVGWDYADEKYGGNDGGNNFPANKFEYTIEMVMGEGWKITNQKLLEQKK